MNRHIKIVNAYVRKRRSVLCTYSYGIENHSFCFRFAKNTIQNLQDLTKFTHASTIYFGKSFGRRKETAWTFLVKRELFAMVLSLAIYWGAHKKYNINGFLNFKNLGKEIRQLTVIQKVRKIVSIQSFWDL